MKHLRKTALSVLLAAVMVCGMLTPAFAVWPQDQSLEATLFTIDGNLWVDDSACVWQSYVDNGAAATVYSPDGNTWFTQTGVQQYYGQTIPSYWMTGTLDSSYSSPDGGMIWQQNYLSAYRSWSSFWSSQPSGQTPMMLYHLPGSAIYWPYIFSDSLYYESVSILSSSVQGFGVHVTSYMGNNGSGDSGSGDRMLFALASEPAPVVMPQGNTIWMPELFACYDTWLQQNYPKATGSYNGLYDSIMRDWMNALKTPVSFNPSTQTVYYGSYEEDPSGTTYLQITPSPTDPSAAYFRPQFLKIKAPCSCTATVWVNLQAAENYYCMLDLRDVYGYGYVGYDPSATQMQFVVNAMGRGYYPITMYGAYTDANDDGVLDPSEAPMGLGNYVMAEQTGSSSQLVSSLHLEAGRTYTIPIYIWNEAQSQSMSQQMGTVDLDVQFSFIPDGADTAPFQCVPYDDGVAVVGIDPDYLFYDEFPIGAGSLITPYSAYDSTAHSLTIPDEIAGMPVRGIFAPYDAAVMNAGVYTVPGNETQNVTTTSYLQQRSAAWSNLFPNIPISLSVDTLILPHTVRVIGSNVCGDALQTVHVPQAAQADAYSFYQCVDTLTICCDLPNSVTQQTLTAANAQRNFTFAVCTDHATHAHSFTNWVVTTPATSASQGEEKRVCTDCGAVETRPNTVIQAGYGFFSGGYGTEASPFLISTAADLDHIDDFYAAYDNHLPSDPVYFTQTADIMFYYNDANDNDGTTGYDFYDPTDPNSGSGFPVRPTPVAQMDNAVYDGGGHTIRFDVYLSGSSHAGVFGQVTDSTIRNLRMETDVGLIGTADGCFVGMIAQAERCLLENITARLYNDIYPWGITAEDADGTVGFLAGSVTDCRVIHSIAQCDSGDIGFIGSANSGSTFRNTWAMGWYTQETAGVQIVGATGVIFDRLEITSEPDLVMNAAHQVLSPGYPYFVLADAQGNVQPQILANDPDATGLRYDLYKTNSVTLAAGEHGSLVGAGEFVLYGAYLATKTVSGLQPVPDIGYVFAGWTIDAQVDPYSCIPSVCSVDEQSDGTYTFSKTIDFSPYDTAVVTANFAPHETHTFGEWTVVTEATCTTDGARTHTCADCGFTENETIPAPGHSYEAAGWVWASDYSGATATLVCGACQDTQTAASASIDVTIVREETCTQDRIERYTATVTFNGQTFTATSDEVTVPNMKTPHDYDATVTEPTCTEGGYTTYVCRTCQDTYIAGETNANGHLWGEWVVTTPATTEAAGEETRTCTVCHFAETRTIDPLTPQGTIRVSPGRTHPGGIARITVSVEDNPGLAAALLRVRYDPAVLTLIDVENGRVFPASTFQPGGDMNEVPFAVSWYDALSTTAYAEDGALVTFTFSVADDAPLGTTPITVMYDTDSTFDPDENDVIFSVDNQPVTIGERMPGDADGDGALSIRDAAVIVRSLVGGWGVHVDPSNADVDGDGKLTLKDVVRIRRFLAGWNVTLQ